MIFLLTGKKIGVRIEDMEKEIEILRTKYGSYRRTAEALEITERTLMRILKEDRASPALRYRILAEAIKATRQGFHN